MDKLTIEVVVAFKKECEQIRSNGDYVPNAIIPLCKQLADTMRENERLREAIQFFFDKPGDSEYDIAQCEDKFKKALSYKDAADD